MRMQEDGEIPSNLLDLETEKNVMVFDLGGGTLDVTLHRVGRSENGLYNILAQSRMEIARSWRRVVHDELINMRKEKGRNIAEQFEEWDHAMDNIYFDEETGQLMQSVTIPGGDVIQIPYEKEE